MNGKKAALCLLIAAVFLLPMRPAGIGAAMHANRFAVIDVSRVSEGCLAIRWTGGAEETVKVLITGPDAVRYPYRLSADGRQEVFPFSAGSGTYSIGVYRRTEGDWYEPALACTVDAVLSDERAPFLHPGQYVPYTPESACARTAAALCAGNPADRRKGEPDTADKIAAIYGFVVSNIAYDRDKAEAAVRGALSGYLPDPDTTLAEGRGICLDYASLCAAMLRSVGIPAQLVTGYAGRVSHAWVQVWSDTGGVLHVRKQEPGSGIGTRRPADSIRLTPHGWTLLDPTYAATAGSDAPLFPGAEIRYQPLYRY